MTSLFSPTPPEAQTSFGGEVVPSHSVPVTPSPENSTGVSTLPCGCHRHLQTPFCSPRLGNLPALRSDTPGIVINYSQRSPRVYHGFICCFNNCISIAYFPFVMLCSLFYAFKKYHSEPGSPDFTGWPRGSRQKGGPRSRVCIHVSCLVMPSFDLLSLLGPLTRW